MREALRDKAIPPRGCSQVVNDLDQRIVDVKRQITEAQNAQRAAAAEAAIAISKTMKPEHDRLRARIIDALAELR